MEPQRAPELRPEISFIFDLVKQLVDGRMRIPKFQRPFVWRRQQMIDLLDSIRNQYPIGSLLAWETDVEVHALTHVGPVGLIESSDRRATYILDGHQRLSTIAGALVSKRDRRLVEDDADPGLWNIYYNARDDVFEHLDHDSGREVHHFPMSSILETFEFLTESQTMLSEAGPSGELYLQRVQSVARAFQNYKIPVIGISQTGLNEAVEIFARLNSKGQSMTADQMVSALLYREDANNSFDLASEITASLELLVGYGFGDLDRTLVLRALLAAAGEDIYRTDWTRIAATRRADLLSRLQAVLPHVNESFVTAAEFLNDSLSVRTLRLMPYAMQFVVISSFFYAQPTPSAVQVKLIKRWFWVTSFARWFGGANPSRVNALVRDVLDNVGQQRSEPKFETFDMELAAQPLPTSFDMRSARTRAFLLVMMSLEPMGRDGSVIDHPDLLIDRFGPDALGYVASTVHDRDLAKSPVNRLLRDDPKDRSQGKAWLLTLPADVEEAVWASHALPLAAKGALQSGDSDLFLQARLNYLVDCEKEFMRRNDVKPPPNDSPLPSPADSED